MTTSKRVLAAWWPCEIAELVDDEDVRLDVGTQGLLQAIFGVGLGKIVDEGCSGCEQGVESVRDCAVCNGGGEMGLAAPGAPTSRQEMVVWHPMNRRSGDLRSDVRTSGVNRAHLFEPEGSGSAVFPGSS